MKREIHKLLARSSTVCLVYAMVLGVLGLLLYALAGIHETNDLSCYLGPYASQAELEALEQEAKQLAALREQEFTEVGLSMEPVHNRLAVFAYVRERAIASGDAVVYSESYPGTSRDAVGLLMTTNGYIFLVMLAGLACLSFLLVTCDFVQKRYVFLYAGACRSTLLRGKALAYLISALTLFVLLEVIGGSMLLFGSTGVDTALVIHSGRVYAFSVFQLWGIEMGSILLQLLPYAIAFFAFAVLACHELVAGALDIGFFLFVRYLASYGPESLRTLTGAPFYNWGFEGLPLGEWFLPYGMMTGVAFVLLLVACWRMMRRNLVL